jgi:capsular polysaccharide transport system permease protein
MRALDIFRPQPLARTAEVGDADVMERYLEGAARRNTVARKAMIYLVLLPTVLATAYYGVVASNRYVSEARFIVRGVSSPRTTGLDMFFRTFGLSRAVDDTNAVQNYMLSRDAVRALEAKLPLKEMFSRADADWIARYPHFWRGESFETLYEYFRESVSVIQDPSKGITEMRVQTFRPDDSLALANALVGLAEDMVNRMNARAQKDAVVDAESEVKGAEQRLIDGEAELTSFRNRELVVDPAKNSLSVVETITSLNKELSSALAQVQELQTTSPGNPVLRIWQAKSDALRSQIASQRAKLGGDNNAFAGKVSTYERLELARDLAEKSLTSAEASLELARQEARRQQVYIEEIAIPNLADKSTEPERVRMIATVFALCFGLFSILWILFVGAREHGH